jgi:pyruvate,water dikinase
MEGCIAELRDLEIPVLPRLEDPAVVTEARGVTSGFELMRAYDSVIQSLLLAYQYHFEMLNLGYGAYLNLFEFCRQAFPGIKDETVVQLVAGTDLLMFGPDDKLKELARLALETGVDQAILDGAGAPGATVEALRGDPRAERWVRTFDEAQDPWFHFSSGTGLYHHERSWIDDLTVPWSALTGYVEKLRAGEDIARPTQEVLDRRERLTAEYRELLTDEDDRTAFDQNVGLARTVAAYVEDHNFFVEHRHHTVFWGKMREVGQRLADGDFLDDREDVFMLNRWEIGQALYDLVMGWSVGAPRPGTAHWRRLIAERRGQLEALGAWSPPPALGPVPDEISEAFTVMLWGITTDRVRTWLGAGQPRTAPCPACPRRPGCARASRGHPDVRRAARGPARRDPRLPDHRPRVGPRVRDDPGRGVRHRRRDEPRGDRLARVRHARGGRHGQRDVEDPHGRPRARRRRHGRVSILERA